ncbi:MAG: hypothetical protein ACI9JY_001450, partial [Saprospiraceae bacterium]
MLTGRLFFNVSDGRYGASGRNLISVRDIRHRFFEVHFGKYFLSGIKTHLMKAVFLLSYFSSVFAL